jgi:hypothetical protein
MTKNGEWVNIERTISLSDGVFMRNIYAEVKERYGMKKVISLLVMFGLLFSPIQSGFAQIVDAVRKKRN